MSLTLIFTFYIPFEQNENDFCENDFCRSWKIVIRSFLIIFFSVYCCSTNRNCLCMWSSSKCKKKITNERTHLHCLFINITINIIIIIAIAFILYIYFLFCLMYTSTTVTWKSFFCLHFPFAFFHISFTFNVYLIFMLKRINFLFYSFSSSVFVLFWSRLTFIFFFSFSSSVVQFALTMLRWNREKEPVIAAVAYFRCIHFFS